MGDGSVVDDDGVPVGAVRGVVSAAEQAVSLEIRRRRLAAGLSQNDLAARVAHQRQYISRAEQPKRGLPSENLVIALDQGLGADGDLVRLWTIGAAEREARREKVATGRPGCGQAVAVSRRVDPSGPGAVVAPRAATVDLYDGLDCAGGLDGTVRTLVQLSGGEVDRRQFLAGGATFAAAAFVEPALFALTASPSANVARAAGRRVGMADVEIIVEGVAHLRRLDNRFGSGRVQDQALHLLALGTSAVREGAYGDTVGRALLGAVAQASWLAGSMSADVGLYALAQRYFVQTLNLAVHAGDRLYAANVLSHMSRLTVQRGDAAREANDRVRHARQAVSLARAGTLAAGAGATPALSALLAAVEARGHALLGDHAEARAAAHRAERHHQRSRPAAEPAWLSFYTDAELAADLSRCLRDTGEHADATDLLTHALSSYEPWRVRSRCFVQIDLAATLLASGEHDQALALAQNAVTAADQVQSRRALDKMRGLQHRFRHAGPIPPGLDDLDRQISALVTALHPTENHDR